MVNKDQILSQFVIVDYRIRESEAKEAMDEYAKQVAIDFAKELQKNYVLNMLFERKAVKENGSIAEVEELYQMYTKQNER